MKNILINASAAKEGGAETILRTFISNLRNNESYNYIVLSPNPIENSRKNIKFIKFRTNGFLTIFFSAIGIYYFVLKFKASKVISFNNINCIVCPRKGITYFHQLKALKPGYKDFKIKVYDFIIRNFLKRNQFVVQSQYIRSLFLNKYNVDRNNIIVSWPGFIMPQEEELSAKLITEITSSKWKKICIFPVSYPAEHKNFSLLEELGNYFKEKKVLVVTLLDSRKITEKPPFLHIGNLSRGQLFRLYSMVDFMIFTSKDETVGLPIFEFIQSGKPAYVLNAPYAEKFYHQFKSPQNFILFRNRENFTQVYHEEGEILNNSIDYSKGEWNKIIELLD